MMTKWFNKAVFTMVLGGLLLSSCDGGGSSGSSGKSEVIGAAGGTLEVTSGALEGAALVVPPGAVASDTRFTIRGGTDIADADTDEAGRAVRILPDGQAFAVPATVRLPFNETIVGGATNALVVLKRDDVTGAVTELIPVAIDNVEHIVSVNTSSLSTFQPALANVSDPDGDFNMVTILTDMREDTGNEQGIISGARVTGDAFSFDGSGGASSTAGDEDSADLTVDAENDSGALVSSSSSFNREVDGVNLFATGQLTLENAESDGLGALSASQEVLVVALPNVETNASALDLAVGLQVGSNMDDGDLTGEYHFLAMGLELIDEGGSATVATLVLTGAFTADGNGTISWDDFNEASALLNFPFTANSASLQVDTDSSLPADWDYSISTDGTMTLNDNDGGDLVGVVAPSGELAVWVARFSEADAVALDLSFAVEQGSGLDEADLGGQYNLYGLGSDLAIGNSSDTGSASVFLFNNGTLEFDGAGDVTLTGLDERQSQLEVGGSGATVTLFTDTALGGSDSGTYTVAANGALTLNLDGTFIGAMSPSGDTLVLTLTENGSTEAARDVMIAVKRP